jgi:GH15 family glucan-1,4-alpha-glucosidase
VQAYASKAPDASGLLLPIVGFLPPSDPRIVGTVSAIERQLIIDELVVRYDTGATEDGLPPGEGAFLACAMFERLLALRNDVGLLDGERAGD